MAEFQPELELRSGCFSDRASFLALADLLRDAFGIDISLLDRFGGPDLTAMPFGYFDKDGRCVANFSAFSMPLTVDGKSVRAVGYQSGAVRPEYRGKGLYRDLMQRAFAWSDAQGFEAGLLMTDKPALYTHYGFASVPQHCFRGSVPTMTGAANSRLISLDDLTDIALVTAILKARSDVSECFAVREATRTFLLNACFDPDIRLSHLPEHHALAAWKQEGGVLQLLDVAAERMPSLDAVVAALGVVADTIEVLFPPDRLSWSGTPVAYKGACDLMVRPSSTGAIPSRPFMLAPSMDF
ncbi:GNAT family N-acetyltransferase [Rhizobium sp.]